MITLNTILRLSDRHQQKFLREVENDELALALQCDENDALIDSLLSNMSERYATEFRGKLEEAKKAVEAEQPESSENLDEEELSETETLPASVAAAREKILAVVARLSENGDIEIPEVDIPRPSKYFVSFLNDIATRASECVCRVQKNRAIFRKYLLEEAEKRDDKKEAVSTELGTFGAEDDLKAVEYEFEAAFDHLLSEFFANSINKNLSAKNALLALGEEGFRQIRARLITGHYDPLEKELAKGLLLFDDIVLLGDRDIQKFLREVDEQDLEVALKGASYDVQEKIYHNMSPRAAGMLKEDIEFMGPVRKSDVVKARNKLVSVLHRLEQKGDIVFIRQYENDKLVH